ncbi:MAG: hypothetical protein HFE62_05055 [Firmicutes bacterium]|nr:hypothetical protein [Bacillota bacterium]
MIEELFCEALKNIECAKENMAVYDGEAAVFFRQAPDSADVKWENGSAFPRIVFDVKWTYDNEMKSDGIVTVDVSGLNENISALGQIADSVISEMQCVFITDESGTYCFVWNGKCDFGTKELEPSVIGKTFAFHVFRFLKQESKLSNPVWSVNDFIKKRHENCVVIGHDTLPKFLRVDAENPTVYVRMTETKNIKTNQAMAWFQTDMGISVLPPNFEKSQKLASEILLDLSIEQETVMQNGSPYLITGVAQTLANDPLKTGQITLSGQHGTMQKQSGKTKLNNAYFS